MRIFVYFLIPFLLAEAPQRTSAPAHTRVHDFGLKQMPHSGLARTLMLDHRILATTGTRPPSLSLTLHIIIFVIFFVIFVRLLVRLLNLSFFWLTFGILNIHLFSYLVYFGLITSF